MKGNYLQKISNIRTQEWNLSIFSYVSQIYGELLNIYSLNIQNLVDHRQGKVYLFLNIATKSVFLLK